MASNTKRQVWTRLIFWFASSRAGSWFFAHTLHVIDRWVFRVSSGRTFATSALTGLPIVMLTTTGAKSGVRRTVPLVGMPDGDNVILIASYYGNTHHPAWYYNLRAHSEVTLTINRRTKDFTAREASTPEYDRYWDQATSFYAGYASYKTRTGGRRIPILVLTPKKSTHGY